MQPLETYGAEISILSHSHWHFHCYVTLVTQQLMRSSQENSFFIFIIT